MLDPTDPEPTDSGEPRFWQPPAWVPPVLLVAIGAVMLTWNPDGWSHPLVDYGRELYVPWRITEGEVLYRDLAYFNGPLSPYLNAMWFRLFGVNMHVLTVVNVAVAALVCALLYRLLVAISDRFTTTICTAMFLFFFVFQHIEKLGNFNWIGPYSHEMTHGIAFTMLAVWLILRHLSRPRLAVLCGVGLCMGLVFLTKPEIFAAAVLTVGTALWAGWYRQRQALADLLRQFSILAGTALVPPLLAFALLASALPAGEAMTGVLGGWVYVFNGELTALKFYAVGRGTHDLLLSIEIIGTWLGLYLAILIPGLGLAWLLRTRASGGDHKPDWLRPGLAVALALSPLLIPSIPRVIPTQPVLVFIVTIGLVLGVKFARHRDQRTMHGVVLTALALGLLPKILFNAGLEQYGFVLAFPAILLSVVALLYWIPRYLERRGWAGGVFRGIGVGMLLFAFFCCLQVVDELISTKTLITGGEHEKFRSGKTNYSMPADFAIQWLLEHTQPTDTVVVLPEGVTINYYARRVNPTGQINFMPPEIVMYGESHVLDRLKAQPPDYCIVIHRETSEYGLDLFGRDYGASIMAWVARNYQPVHRLGEQPLHPDRLKDRLTAMLIMQRRR